MQYTQGNFGSFRPSKAIDPTQEEEQDQYAHILEPHNDKAQGIEAYFGAAQKAGLIPDSLSLEEFGLERFERFLQATERVQKQQSSYLTEAGAKSPQDHIFGCVRMITAVSIDWVDLPFLRSRISNNQRTM